MTNNSGFEDIERRVEERTGFDDEGGFEDETDLEDEDVISLDDVRSRDADGVGALHDVEAEAGDETELDDLFDLDESEARDLGADFTGDQRDEPRLR